MRDEGEPMSIGGGIALIVIGAILAFALDVQVSGIDIQLIGYILIAAGVLITLLGIVFLTRRRQVTSTSRSAVDPVTGERVTRRSTEDGGGPVV
jgi:membrane-bound ClpP family serine protease